MEDVMRKALRVQVEQEAQMKKELNTLLNRFALEYSVTVYQIVGLLEETKIKAMDFTQFDDIYFMEDHDEDYE